MRVFWAIVAALMIAAIVAFAGKLGAQSPSPSSTTRRVASEVSQPTASPRPQRPEPSSQPEPQPESRPEPQQAAPVPPAEPQEELPPATEPPAQPELSDVHRAPEGQGVPAEQPNLIEPAPEPNPEPSLEPDPTDTPELAAGPEPEPEPLAEPAQDPEPVPDPEQLPEPASPEPTEVIPTEEPAAPKEPVGWAIDTSKPPSTPAPEPKPAAETSAPEPTSTAITTVDVQHNDDGSITLDTRYKIKGDGTKDNPYELTWDLLISASQTYEPQKGKKEMPGRIDMLDDTHIAITGYVTFPLNEDEPKELLVMLNEWDGCCIGIPPTPYDAIEATLTSPVPREKRFATYGTVRGTLKIDPYLVGEWLVGLYVIENATFEAK